MLEKRKFEKKNLPNVLKKYLLKSEIKEPILVLGCGQDMLKSEFKKKGLSDATLSDVENFGGYTKDFVIQDLNKFPFRFNKKYQTVFLIGTIQYVENPFLVLKEIHDILEEKGKLFVNFYKKGLDKYPKSCPLLYVFSEKTASNLIRRSGFKVFSKNYNANKRIIHFPWLAEKFSNHTWFILEK